jgi:hypothetical protein
MDEFYGNFDTRDVDWDAAWDEWSPKVTSASDDDALWDALTGMLATTDDGHVQMLRPGEEFWSANTVYRERIGDDRFDLEVVRDVYLGSWEGGDDDGFTWGTLPDGTPYVHLAWIAQNCRAVRQVLDANPDADALVVDLRHNGGGDFTWAYHHFGVLTDTERAVFRSRTRTGPTWTLKPRGEHRDVRIVLLTDRYTISAGERATMALQTLPDAITLGEPTNGALATMIGRELPNRWGLALPIQEVFTPDGQTTWEGVGLPVDEEILDDPADLAAGIDAVLERAMALLQ